MRLAGIVLVVLSAGSVGFRIALALKKRCRLLRQLIAALQLLKNEIAVCATPLPQAFALMAVAVDGPLEQLFSAVAREMDRNRFLTPLMAVRQALREIRYRTDCLVYHLYPYDDMSDELPLICIIIIRKR